MCPGSKASGQGRQPESGKRRQDIPLDAAIFKEESLLWSADKKSFAFSVGACQKKEGKLFVPILMQI